MSSIAGAPTTPPSDRRTVPGLRDNHLNAWSLIEQHGHVYVVGDDEEIFVGSERLGDLLSRRADVDEQGAAVGNEGASGLQDR